MGAVGTVLVVDDDDRMRQALRHALMTGGYLVTLAHDSTSARYAAQDRVFDAAIIEQRLTRAIGDRSGLALAEQLIRQGRAARVVIHTGFSSPDAAFCAAKFGVVEYLPKPATRDEILAAIRGAPKPSDTSPPTVERVVRDHCARVLAACDDERERAAAMLGVHRNTLARILDKPTPKR